MVPARRWQSWLLRSAQPRVLPIARESQRPVSRLGRGNPTSATRPSPMTLRALRALRGPLRLSRQRHNTPAAKPSPRHRPPSTLSPTSHLRPDSVHYPSKPRNPRSKCPPLSCSSSSSSPLSSACSASPPSSRRPPAATRRHPSLRTHPALLVSRSIPTPTSAVIPALPAGIRSSSVAPKPRRNAPPRNRRVFGKNSYCARGAPFPPTAHVPSPPG